MECAPDTVRLAIGINNTGHITISKLWAELTEQRCAECNEPAPFFDVLIYKRRCLDPKWLCSRRFAQHSSRRSLEHRLPELHELLGCMPQNANFPPSHITGFRDLRTKDIDRRTLFDYMLNRVSVENVRYYHNETERYRLHAQRSLENLYRSITSLTPRRHRPKLMWHLRNATLFETTGCERTYLCVYAPWVADAALAETPQHHWETGFMCMKCYECGAGSSSRPRERLLCFIDTFEAALKHKGACPLDRRRFLWRDSPEFYDWFYYWTLQQSHWD